MKLTPLIIEYRGVIYCVENGSRITVRTTYDEFKLIIKDRRPSKKHKYEGA